MRKINFVPGEYYHIVNRGVHKQKLFIDTRDYSRFLFLILYFQSPESFINIGRFASYFVKHRVFNISEKTYTKIIREREVNLHAFCIMPNHFHLLISEEVEGGISRYLQRVQNSYGKYFNTRYSKSGHVFEGPFRAVLIEDNEQLLHTSAYIHRNPIEMKRTQNEYEQYPWSSYLDYTTENRWKLCLDDKPIAEQFDSIDKYKKFVQTSPTKMLNTECLTF